MIFKKPNPDNNIFVGDSGKNITKFNLPLEFKYCSKCLLTNQRPTTRSEHSIKEDITITTRFFKDVCEACIIKEKQELIDWDKKKFEFKKLLDKYRSRNGSYDVVVPGSGGKDSFYVAHRLKYEYGMNPITVTFSPFMYTDWGFKNLKNWINAGFENFLNTPNQKIYRLLSRLALEKLFHPWHPWILGQKNYPTKFARMFKVPLIIYGESPSEYGSPVSEYTSQYVKEWHTYKKLSDIRLSGCSLEELYSYGVKYYDLYPFLPLQEKEFEESELNCCAFSYYHKWHPQENYYYTMENSPFHVSPERTAGTYSKYNGIDDKMDDMFFYTYYIKYGFGRTTHDVAQEIRNGDLTVKEGLQLVKKFDGEYPSRFDKDIFEYLSMPKDIFGEKISNLFETPIIDKEYFFDLSDNFRSPHLWTKTNKGFELRNKIENFFPEYFSSKPE
tara:strand:+ start:496 stop:1824 length:1329 start_codon:yes stop_codon:yes gene_type:complete